MQGDRRQKGVIGDLKSVLKTKNSNRG